MKYICLGYIEPGKIEGMTEDERHAMLDDCFEYNDHLRANGHLVAEVPLQPPGTALTLYGKNGKVATTDGPYAETKEQVGGIQILEARDLNHAMQLISQQRRDPDHCSPRAFPRGRPHREVSFRRRRCSLSFVISLKSATGRISIGPSPNLKPGSCERS